LYVPGIVEQVGQDNRIERAVYPAQVVCIGLDHIKVRVPVPGSGDSLGREVDAQTVGRAYSRQKVAVAAAEFEDPESGPQQKAVDLLNASMVDAAAAPAWLPRSGDSVPVGGASFAILLGVAVRRRCRHAFSLILRRVVHSRSVTRDDIIEALQRCSGGIADQAEPSW
jgi:hypothetical protein